LDEGDEPSLTVGLLPRSRCALNAGTDARAAFTRKMRAPRGRMPALHSAQDARTDYVPVSQLVMYSICF